MMHIRIKQISAACFLLGGTFLMLSLGMWQLDRLGWKTEIIHELDRQYNSSNLPLYSYENLAKANEEGRDILYGHIRGQALWDKEIFYGPKAKDRAMGFHIITPVALKRDHIILVNRGWISEADKKNYTAPQHARLQFTGLIRKPDWNSFTPNNSPDHDIWTKLDVSQIAAAQGLQNALPFILYAHQSSKDLAPAQLLEEKWYPRNKHAQYATFWFSMAFFFIIFFGYYAYQSKKSKQSK